MIEWVIVWKADSRGRMVLPEKLRKDKVAVTRFGNRAIIVPMGDPYEYLCGKILGSPLKELRETNGMKSRIYEGRQEFSRLRALVSNRTEI